MGSIRYFTVWLKSQFHDEISENFYCSPSKFQDQDHFTSSSPFVMTSCHQKSYSFLSNCLTFFPVFDLGDRYAHDLFQLDISHRLASWAENVLLTGSRHLQMLYFFLMFSLSEWIAIKIFFPWGEIFKFNYLFIELSSRKINIRAEIANH